MVSEIEAFGVPCVRCMDKHGAEVAENITSQFRLEELVGPTQARALVCKDCKQPLDVKINYPESLKFLRVLFEEFHFKKFPVNLTRIEKSLKTNFSQ